MKIQLSKTQWQHIGKQAGWIKTAKAILTWDLKKEEIKSSDPSLYELVEKIIGKFCPNRGEGCVFSTKELGKFLGIGTNKAYDICVKLEKGYDILYKYGYQTKTGWEDPQFSSKNPQSLHWQFNVEFKNESPKLASLSSNIKISSRLMVDLPPTEEIGGKYIVYNKTKDGKMYVTVHDNVDDCNTEYSLLRLKPSSDTVGIGRKKLGDNVTVQTLLNSNGVISVKGIVKK